MRTTLRPHIAAVLLALLAALGVVSAAVAQSDGRLSASGSGSAVVDGRVVMYGALGGRNAQIRVEDRAGDASFMVNGRPVTAKRSRRKIEFRYSGPATFVISGSSLRAEITGDVSSLSVVGTGVFRLSGRGTFVLNDTYYPAWKGRTMTLDVPAPASVRRDRRTTRSPGLGDPRPAPPAAVPIPAAP